LEMDKMGWLAPVRGGNKGGRKVSATTMTGGTVPIEWKRGGRKRKKMHGSYKYLS